MRASEISQRSPELADATISLRDGAVSFVVRFDKTKVTRHWVTSADNRDGVLGFYEALLEVITGWDLVNDDGTPYPLTVENLAALNLDLQDEQDVVLQIMQAAQPSSEEGNASRHTSSTPPTSSGQQPASPLNGQQTSPSPRPSESPSPT